MKLAACVTTVVLLAGSFCMAPAAMPAAAQEAVPSPAPNPATDAGMLEVTLRHSAIDSPEYGRTLGAYWGLIGRTKDFPRAYSFFESVPADAGKPNATLLAEKASAAGAYVGWLYQQNAQEQVGEAQVRKIVMGAITEYDQALTLEPDNFAALYGYAVFEGYRPEGKEHQKELLARLDALRLSKPYLPWAMVDHLEKTGSPE